MIVFGVTVEPVLTIKALHAGDGFEYLLRSVATADRQRSRGQSMTDYYTANGTPPGQWWGRGAALMGVSGEVTEAQMRALYGEGIHPDADQKIIQALDEGKTVDAALAAARLGSGHSAFGRDRSPICGQYEADKAAFLVEHRRAPDRQEWLDLRVGAARKHLLNTLGRNPSGEEINAALADEKRTNRAPVVAFDMVATGSKSEAILWALADEQTRAFLWRCHLEALHETFTTAQDNYALARRGAGGKRVIDAEGFTVAMYHHWDNRTGDPTPHTHAVVSSRVQGSDGKWCALDARALYAATVSLSCEYNARRIGKIKRGLGLRYQPSYRNGANKAPVMEIAGIPEGLIRLFSRRPDILAETEKLVRAYRHAHGRNPSKKTQIHLAQQATLATREGKPVPKSLVEMFDEWVATTEAFLGDGRTSEQFIAEVLRWNRHPDTPRPYDAYEAAIRAGMALGGSAAITEMAPAQVRIAVAATVDRCRGRGERESRERTWQGPPFS